MWLLAIYHTKLSLRLNNDLLSKEEKTGYAATPDLSSQHIDIDFICGHRW